MRNWRGAIERELQRPFAPGEAPLARFIWFAGSGGKAVAAMVFHHAIADGRSGTAVMLDVLRRATTDTSPPVYKRANASSQSLDVIREQAPMLSALQGVRFWLAKGKEALHFAQQLPGYDMKPSTRHPHPHHRADRAGAHVGAAARAGARARHDRARRAGRGADPRDQRPVRAPRAAQRSRSIRWPTCAACSRGT